MSVKNKSAKAANKRSGRSPSFAKTPRGLPREGPASVEELRRGKMAMSATEGSAETPRAFPLHQGFAGQVARGASKETPIRTKAGYFEKVGVYLFLVFLILITFYRLLDTQAGLQAGDAPMYQAHQVKQMLSEASFSATGVEFGFGQVGPVIIGDWTVLVYLLVPEGKAFETMMAISVFVAAFFFYLFLRERGCSVVSSLVGCMTMGFSTGFVSLANAGHLGKFVGISHMCVALWLMERFFRKERLITAGFGGLAVGYGLAWGLDTCLILGLGAGVFWLKELLSVAVQRRKIPVRLVGGLVLAGVVALIVAMPSAQMRNLGPKEGDEVQTERMVEQDKWEWATQWSLPSDELVKLVCASYFGYDSWDEKAPYWGEMGRSADWEKTRQGFRNFTQTNEYLGLVAVVLAFIAVYAYGFRRSRRPQIEEARSLQADTLFWFGLSVVGLLLALGKYSPFYRLFYSVPYMSSIRNPVKFLHVVTLGVAVLAARGAHYLEKALSMTISDRRRALTIGTVVSGLLAVIFIILLLTVPTSSTLVSRLEKDGFGAQIQGIQGAMMTGLAVSFGFCVLMTGMSLLPMIRASDRIPFAKKIWLTVLVALLVIDFSKINRKFIRYEDYSKSYQSNVVIDYLRPFLSYRVKFIPHTWGMFNYWNSLLVPYYKLRSADATAESRTKADIARFRAKVGANPARFWQLTGVRHLVVPKEIAAQIEKLLGNKVRRVKGFNFVQGYDMAAVPQWTSSVESSNFLILEYQDAMPSAQWYGQARCVEFEQALNLLSDPGFDPTSMLLLSDAGARSTPEQTGRVTNAVAVPCELLEYGGSRVRIRYSSDRDGWVLVNDYYDHRWRATVGDDSVPVLRADGIFYAVKVPAGAHEIDLKYQENDRVFYVPLSCLILLVGMFTVSRFSLWLRKGKGCSTADD